MDAASSRRAPSSNSRRGCRGLGRMVSTPSRSTRFSSPMETPPSNFLFPGAENQAEIVQQSLLRILTLFFTTHKQVPSLLFIRDKRLRARRRLALRSWVRSDLLILLGMGDGHAALDGQNDRQDHQQDAQIGKNNKMFLLPMGFMIIVTICSLLVNTKNQIAVISAGGGLAAFQL